MDAPPIFSELPVQLGVYNLTKRLGVQERSELYLAKQTHVERRVIIEVLRPDAGEEEAARFVATARQRVTNPLPHTAKVLESMVSDGIWYITQELPPGSSLPDRAATEPPTIELLCEIIRDASELYIGAQQANLAVTPLTADSIYLSRLKGNHFLSPVTEGEAYTADMQINSMQQLSLVLSPYVPEGVPGHTRLCTLLDWLYRGYEGQLLSWEVIADTAKTILKQLNPTAQAADLRENVKLHDANSDLRKQNRYRRRMTRSLLLSAACLLIIAIMSQLGRLFVTDEPTELSPQTPAGILARQNGGTVLLMRHPVTINEYAQFLSRLQSMRAENKQQLDTGIPESARDHTPDDWDNMYQSALQGWTWNGRELTLQSPVVGVSYWDARAYARHAGADLPPANLLQQANQLAPSPAAEEWTGSHINGDAVVGDCTVVLSTRENLPQAEYNPGHRKPDRTFRLMRTGSAPSPGK